VPEKPKAGSVEDLAEYCAALIKSKSSLNLIVTPEEHRVKEFMMELSKTLDQELFIWDIVNGLTQAYPKKTNRIKNSEDLVEPNACLEYIKKDIAYSDGKAGGIFLLCDFAKHWGGRNAYEDNSVLQIIRRLKQFGRHEKSLNPVYFENKVIFIVSHSQNIPEDLQKLINVIDFPLPDKARVSGLLNQFIKGHNEQIKAQDPTKSVEYAQEECEKIISGCLGLTISEIVDTFIIQTQRYKRINPDEIIRAKEAIVRKNGLIEYVRTEDDIDNIGGLEQLKIWLSKRKNGFTEAAANYGLPYPKGILLVGVQGCGKSLSAKAAASLYKMPLLRLDVGKVFGGIVGESERNMRDTLKLIDAVGDCILWLDEIEKGMAGTRSSDRSDAGTASRVFQSFLTWTNERKSSAFIIATANDVSALPPELMRKGRFDEIFFVDLPKDEERKEIFSIHLNKKKRPIENYNLDELVSVTDGYSGAEIEQAIVDAMFTGFSEGREFCTGDIIDAVEATVPLSTTMRENIEALREWARSRARNASYKEEQKNKTEYKDSSIEKVIENIDFND
jgi:AAA+ superfamily predicted ATPase